LYVIDDDVLAVQVESHDLSPTVGEALLDAAARGVRGRDVDGVALREVAAGGLVTVVVDHGESDRIFGKHFIDAVTELMCLEDGTVSCIVNRDITPVLEFGSVAAIYIDRITTIDEYNEALRSGGPGNGWLYRVDRYVCVSDAGAWCIYCEKSNDVAVIALRDDADYERFHGPLGQLWAKPIKELVEGGASALFPFDHLVPEWRKALLENYGDGQQCKPR